jgi:release factor glutamine methyltransferase
MTPAPYLPHFISERAKILEDAGVECARVEVEWMLCHVLEVDRLNLYMHGQELLNDQATKRIDEIMARRVKRYPLQFILEEAFFYGRKFFVNSSVMAPTPETESLCEAAIGTIRTHKLSAPRILDVGTGSGVIAVTMAAEVDDISVVALDISGDALEVAKKNGRDLDVADKIDFRLSDFFAAIAPEEKFDIIMSNPPYITDGDYPTLQREVLEDPKIAMVGGADGLDAIRAIIAKAPDHLTPGGRIMFEIGFGQVDQIAKITEDDPRYTSFSYLKDLMGVDRIIILGCSDQR